MASDERTEVVICGLTGSVARTLRTLDILRDLPPSRQAGTLEEARRIALALIDG